MKAAQRIALLSLLGLVSITHGAVVGCSAELDAYIWNLNPLRRSPEEGDYKVTFTNPQGEPTTLHFNLCSNTVNKCTLASESKGDYEDDFANIFLADGQCHRLTEDDMDESIASYIDPQVPEYGLRLEFTSTEKCTADQMYGFTIDIRCDEDVKRPIPRLATQSVATNHCHPKVYLDSDAGCVNRSFNKLWTFFQDMVDELGVALILLGLFMTFFGSKYPQATLFFAGSGAATLICIIILYGFILPSFIPDWGHMAAFFLSIVLGIIFGALAAMWTKVGLFLLGGWLGGTTGMMVYEAVFAEMFGAGPKAQIGFWSVLMIFIALGAIITVYLYEHAIAVASAIVGAYCLVRGSGIFIGGFPNEYLVYQEVANGSYASMPDEFYIYLGVYAFLAIVGIVVQEWNRICGKGKSGSSKNKDQKKKGFKDEYIQEEYKDDEERPLITRKNKK